MLKELRIRNLALIEEGSLALEKGLTVITGETGAGKSVFLTALRLLGGEKFSKNLLRHGSGEARVEGVFDLSALPRIEALLAEQEIDSLDGELVMERTLTESGKTRNRINGSVVSQAVLQQFGEVLLQSHGQSEQLLLRDIRTHGTLLDTAGGHNEVVERYRRAWLERKAAEAAVRELRERQRELAAQEEFLRFQYEELHKAKLKEGEEEELTARLHSVATRGEQLKWAEQANLLLRKSGGSLSGELLQLSKTVERLASFLPEYSGYTAPLLDAQLLLQELEGELDRFAENTGELSEDELDRLNGRLALLQRLQRKYHADLAGLIELKNRRGEELAGIGNFETDLADAIGTAQRADATLTEAAGALHKARTAAAKALSTSVEKELRQLGMSKARFSVRFQWDPDAPDYTADGPDHPEFFAAVNPGEGDRPLRNSLSGGELSRFMLALKSTLAENDTTPVLLFDEVEAGISGETGHHLGERLAALGKHHQVITVSHLHQIAARADHHVGIFKESDSERTRTSVRPLSRPERVQEVARMLGAPEDSATREHAETLLLHLSPQ